MSPGGRLRPPEGFAEAIPEARYARLLGYPGDEIPSGAAAALADCSRAWYAAHGRPWAVARSIELERIEGPRVLLADGTIFEGAALAARLRDGEAKAVIAAAVSAGPEVDDESARLWAADKPDESYALERFGVTVAEALAAWTADDLRARATLQEADLLPAYSPGYDGWPLTDQPSLFGAVTAAGAEPPPGPLQVLDSGMLTPKSSLLALFGWTTRTDLARRAWARHRCTWCSLAGCGFRRTRNEGRAQGAPPTSPTARPPYNRPGTST